MKATGYDFEIALSTQSQLWADEAVLQNYNVGEDKNDAQNPMVYTPKDASKPSPFVNAFGRFLFPYP